MLCMFITEQGCKAKTPYEIFTRNKPGSQDIQSSSEGHKTKAVQGNKVGAKVCTGIHVGYATGNAYKSYIPELGRDFIWKDVTFIEKLYRRKSTEEVPAISNPGN